MFYFCINRKARSASTVIIRPVCDIALSIFPLALILFAVVMEQLKSCAIPAIPYTRFRFVVLSSSLLDSRCMTLYKTSANSPAVMSIIRFSAFTIPTP